MKKIPVRCKTNWTQQRVSRQKGEEMLKEGECRRVPCFGYMFGSLLPPCSLPLCGEKSGRSSTLRRLGASKYIAIRDEM